MGDTTDVQFTQPIRYVEAMIALGRGDLPAARDAVAAGLAGGTLRAVRYAWPLVWLGMRVEADEATRCRDRREEVPAQTARHCAELARTAAQLATPAPSWRGYQALVAAEHARAAGTGEAAAWSQAVAAWQDADEPYPLAYALLRLAEAHCAAGEPAARCRAGPAGACHRGADRGRTYRRRGRRPGPPGPAQPGSGESAASRSRRPGQRRSRPTSWPGSG